MRQFAGSLPEMPRRVWNRLDARMRRRASAAGLPPRHMHSALCSLPAAHARAVNNTAPNEAVRGRGRAYSVSVGASPGQRSKLHQVPRWLGDGVLWQVQRVLQRRRVELHRVRRDVLRGHRLYQADHLLLPQNR